MPYLLRTYNIAYIIRANRQQFSKPVICLNCQLLNTKCYAKDTLFARYFLLDNCYFGVIIYATQINTVNPYQTIPQNWPLTNDMYLHVLY